MLRIFADENLFDVELAFGQYGWVTTLPGRQIGRKTTQKADVLLVRSVTKVDAKLLEGTPVRFVGSATSGTDHMDLSGLAQLGVHVTYTPGSNAPSVGDYIVAGVLSLCARHGRKAADLTCAVIGCGAVGALVATRLEALGLSVLRCDPPLHDALHESGKPSPYVDTDDAIATADVVTIHVPLHDIAPYGTINLIDADRLASMKSDAWIINTSRGGVVDETALIRRLTDLPNSGAITDVWVGEPKPSCRLHRLSYIATPHIAGYAFESKLRATWELRDAFASWLGEEGIPSTAESFHRLNVWAPPRKDASDEEWLHDLVRAVYDIEADHKAMKSICRLNANDRGAFFDGLRRNYPQRHELSRYQVSASSIPKGLERAVTEGLGMAIV